MGWKAVKEHYQIGHIVHVRRGKMMIGSPYITEMFILENDGSFETCRSMRGYEGNDLKRYTDAFTADPAKLAALIAQPDTFGDSITVFSAEDGKIKEQLCEEFGWPNVTHDGELMYENTHFLTRQKALENGLRNMKARIENVSGLVEEARQKLAELVAYQIEAQTHHESYLEIEKTLTKQ